MDSSEYREFNQEKLPSNRSFGATFGIIFFIIAILYKLKNLDDRANIGFFVSGVFLILAYFYDRALFHPNRLWHKLGRTIAKLMNPIILSILFFIVIMPTGFILRKLKILDYKTEFKSNAESFWIPRDQESQNKERIEMPF